MNTYLNYIIEANIGLLLFTIFYFILFVKETQFAFKRWYLLITIGVSLLFPLMKFQTEEMIIPSLSSVIQTMILPEIVVNGGGPSTSESTIIDYWKMAVTLYLVIACIFLLSFFIRIGKLLLYLKANAFTKDGRFRIIESTMNHPSFSFFNYIFIGNVQQLNQQEKDQIINHEKFHAHRIHSLDLVVSEALKIVFWFNPVVYILKNQLASIHEYEADDQAIQHHNANEYCELLARGSLASAGFSLANHFHNSLILKRIVMINAQKTKMKPWKYVMLVPIFVIGFLAFSCQDETKLETISTRSGDYPAEVVNMLEQLKTDYPGDEYVVIELNAAGQEKLNKLNIKAIGEGETYKNIKGLVTAKKDQARSFVILVKGEKKNADQTVNRALLPEVAKGNANDMQGKIYEAVDTPPTFQGGMPAFTTFLTNELRYPPQARSNGTQGKVFVSFVVDENGKISEVSLVKGIGSGCDAEALRVISLMPNWRPGKTNGKVVSVRYIVPINFQL